MQPSAATNRQWTMASGRAVGAAPHFAHTSAGAASGSTSGGIAAADRGVGGNWGVGGAAASASGVVMGIGGGGIGDGGVGGGLATVPPPAAPAMGTGRLVYQRGQSVQPLAVHNRSAIHNPARRVLKALGLEAAYSTAAGGGGNSSDAGAPPPAPASAVTSGGDLFGDM
eukprot:CAMPEP_0181042224 /NCGR_PEP_ID=MMETSP1070-20121207/12035_1 /TAXON_ID=265543 /ORGANISM="Minutocellus polymorphus, Strain NH13" /LENGTH=168 /DNA_ID=CAMNT_0023120421 /DNA_START=84 /DNA_END=591 /DNA_ORIENTATION=+